MRVIIIFWLLIPFIKLSGQSVNAKVTNCKEAVSAVIRNQSENITAADLKKLTRDVESLWFQMIFQINRHYTLASQSKVMADLERVSSLHYTQGNINQLEEISFFVQSSEVNTSLAVAETEIEILKNQLRLFLFPVQNIQPSDTILYMYEIIKPSGDNYLNGTTNTPLNPQDTAREMYEKNRVAMTIENLKLHLDSHFIRLRFYESTGLDYAQKVLLDAEARYKSEDIDYLEYISFINPAFELQIRYLETLNEYNQDAIQLEYYAY
jgi:hypothetical protein